MTELIECRRCVKPIEDKARAVQVRVGWILYPEGEMFDFDADEDLGYYHEACFPPPGSGLLVRVGRA